MVSNTPNHEYDKPANGEVDWGDEVNSNFDDLEIEVDIKDVEANVNTYTPTDTATFLATDTGAVYQADGLTWTKATREFQSVNSDQLNNEYVASTSDDIQTVVDAVKADYGQGSVRLLPGDHTVSSPVSIPVGVTVYSPNASEQSGARAQVAPSGDNGVFQIEMGDTDRASGALRGIDIDATSVGGYSSIAVDIVGGASESPRFPIVENCALHSSTGTGIRVDADTNTAGLGYLKLKGVEWVGWDSCLHLKATAGGAYINAFQGKELYMRGGANEMILEEGSIGNPYYELEAQIGTSTGAVITATSEFVMDVLMYDAANSPNYPGGKFWDLSTASIQTSDPVQIHSRRDEAGRGGLVTTNPLRTIQNPTRNLRWDITETQLPYWLEEAGTGTLTFASSTPRATLTSGSTSGDTKIVQSGLLPTGSSSNPLFGWKELVADTTQTVTASGITDPNGNFEARFYADPTDTLGTGITTNYIFRVVDTDGTEVLTEDTGVAFGSRETLGIGLLAGDVVYGATASSDSVTTLQSLTSTVTDHNFRWQVETQENATKRLTIDIEAGMSWVDG